MNRARYALLVAVALLVVPAWFAGGTALAAGSQAAASSPVTASITGPQVVGTSSTDTYHVSGWGGPAVAANGTVVGNLTYYASLVGPNLTGITFTPASSAFHSNRSISAQLSLRNTTEALTVDIEVSSVFQGRNDSTNVSISLRVVQPYVISATIVNPSNATVAAFPLFVTLDGAVIGEVNVSSIAPGGSTRVTFDYPTVGLATGWHTFAISLAQEHGLVTFSNGQSVYSVSVYITGPAPDYTLWIIAGIAAFFVAIFIFLTRVAARRRGTARR